MTTSHHDREDILTPAELAILHALADGDNQTQIAHERGVDRETIKTQTKAIRWKLGAKTAAHAVAIAYHHGILTPRTTPTA